MYLLWKGVLQTIYLIRSNDMNSLCNDVIFEHEIGLFKAITLMKSIKIKINQRMST